MEMSGTIREECEENNGKCHFEDVFEGIMATVRKEDDCKSLLVFLKKYDSEGYKSDEFPHLLRLPAKTRRIHNDVNKEDDK